MTERPVVRMTASQRWQHFILATSFIVLAVTGFALKFPDSWLAKVLGSSEPFRRWAHRIAGIVMLLIGAYHLIYLLATRDGRKLVADLFPGEKRCADVWQAVRYLAGLTKDKAENRPLRLCRKNGILGGRLGHDHHGRDRPGHLVEN
jgi:Ni,Fe-hydrogenase I cytochrome b subunit